MRAVIVTNRVKRYVNGFKSMIEPLMELGYEVIWVADFTQFKEDLSLIPCKIYQTDFRSNPFNPNNLKAYSQLLKLLKQEPVDLMHCNTPIGGLIGRLCAKRAKVKKVIYTAHGFHFYKGAPFINRTLFKWGEKYLAHYTDILLTINQEDFNAAQSFKLRNNGQIFLIHGAGVDTGYINTYDPRKKRKEIGIPDSSIVIFSAGELNKNKNNQAIIKAISKVNNKNIYYVLCGEGKLRPKLENLSRDLGISERVKFLGFRTDVLDILPATDIFAMPSFREGLPRSLMEAMDAGLPCIVSNIRGNVDLIEDGVGGFLRSPTDISGYSKAIEMLATNQELRKRFGETNKENVRTYDIENVKSELKDIYSSINRI
ncbi:glycosyltransferase family 4 protein [Anaerosalibacter massiliensis]|uniref:glycosyltransferase family 4 protein n=1 Tax=Anaerosalibacter massiliensis TaxID=1347392 RepID=UPI0005B29AFA|nr:glycosyltransferase family 4 protein [Anaerosalibacter massiliensis]